MNRFGIIFGVVLAGVLVSQAIAEDQGATRSPKISFEATTYDFGQVGQSTKNKCPFKFTNIGTAPLEIKSVKSTCGCAITELSKTSFAPGQSGVLTITYTAGKIPTTTKKNIYLTSNDPANPKVKLTLTARIVRMVEVIPAKLDLSPREENLGVGDIVLRSINGQAFSIESFHIIRGFP